MKLGAYLEAREESVASFARRAGLSYRTVYNVLTDVDRLPSLKTAYAIIKASREEPAPDKATVTLRDLVGAA